MRAALALAGLLITGCASLPSPMSTPAPSPLPDADGCVRWLQALDAEVARHQIEWLWVKGHSGHPENERCDVLARDAASGKQLAEDTGYQP